MQIDLGKAIPIDSLRLIPARPTDFPDTPGFGFPKRFKIQVSGDATLARSETVADYSDSDFANPGDEPVVVPVKHRRRYIRVTATRLWPRTNDFVFALAELQAISHGKNVALGANVAALDSIEAGRWSKRHLVDNFSSRGKLADDSNPAATERMRLESRLRTAEKQRAELVEKKLDEQTRRERDRLVRRIREAEASIKATSGTAEDLRRSAARAAADSCPSPRRC